MGYTHYFEIDRTLTAEEFEIVGADARAIVKTAGEAGIVLCGSDFGDVREVVINNDEIMLDGVGDESAEPLYITREPRKEAHNPTLNWCKTYRRNYSPVVEAVLMALKQAAPQSVMVSSNGRWGFEWLHGPGCFGGRNGDAKECLDSDQEHVGLSGRLLYSLAFPGSTEPMYTFESPLKGTSHEGQRIHMPRDMECRLRRSGFAGLPFGVTWEWLFNQAKRSTPCRSAWSAGRRRKRGSYATIRHIMRELQADVYDPVLDWYNWNTPMCSFCLNGRLLRGHLFGYTFGGNPFRLVEDATTGLYNLASIRRQVGAERRSVACVVLGPQPPLPAGLRPPVATRPSWPRRNLSG